MANSNTPTNPPAEFSHPLIAPAAGTAVAPWGQISPEQQQQRINSAISEAKQAWPRLANWNVKLQPVPGQAGNSETYAPGMDANTDPHNWLITLYSNTLDDPNPRTIRDTVGLESLHYLQKEDPTYQNFTEQFIKSMTPEQHAAARQVYVRGLAQGEGGPFMTSYDKFLRHVQAQEYIRGGVDLWPVTSWRTENRSDPYTPQQNQLMQHIANYLKTPNQNDPSYTLNRLQNSGAIR